MASERRYAIGSHGAYGFHAGVTPTNEQVLVGLLCPLLVALRFDSQGNLIGAEQRPIPFLQDVEPPYNLDDERIPSLLNDWKKELLLREATIKVKKFSVPEIGVFVEDHPSYFHEVNSDPDADEEEKADILESMKSWDEDRQFVLQWGDEYWLDETGDVVSS